MTVWKFDALLPDMNNYVILLFLIRFSVKDFDRQKGHSDMTAYSSEGINMIMFNFVIITSHLNMNLFQSYRCLNEHHSGYYWSDPIILNNIIWRIIKSIALVNADTWWTPIFRYLYLNKISRILSKLLTF